MTDFLRTVVQSRTFAPFTTLDFVGDLAAFSGIDLRSQFVAWLYDAREPALFQAAAARAYADEKTLNLDPSWTTRSRR
jgi:hypothetical protein